MNQQSTNTDADAMFFQLVLSLQAGAMTQMGKVASQLTGEIERNMDMARNSIELLAMLEKKTKGNLTDDEQKVLNGVLYELRMNYMDELKKDETTTDKKKDDATTETPTPEADETSGESKPVGQDSSEKGDKNQ
ncbi:MAG: DUF1844 domain-containing protein [candidate division Zixibacteria bacterium]|nr:DUF1844 domain-containing protein [candidate division Zixibacteria bacterium]